MKAQTAPVKFLLVDDREENLVALEALLRRDGLEILRARTGDQALELLLVHDVALAFLDVQMPEMDGFALAELMRGSERSRHVPIIFVTAAVQEQHRIFQGYDAGAVDFLFKPIEPRVLKHKASVFFDLYRQRQELAEMLRVNETFVAAIGHDLKSPIHSIALAADLILRHPPDDATKRHAERIRGSSRRMARMIDDLFDLARVRLSGGIPLEPAAAWTSPRSRGAWPSSAWRPPTSGRSRCATRETRKGTGTPPASSRSCPTSSATPSDTGRRGRR